MKLTKTHGRTGADIPLLGSPYIIVRPVHKSGVPTSLRVDISPSWEDRNSKLPEHVLHLSVDEAWDLSRELQEKLRIIVQKIANWP
jgi:hypothetical protein